MSRTAIPAGTICDFGGCKTPAKVAGKSVTGLWCLGHYQQQWAGQEMKTINVRVDPSTVTEKTCKTCRVTKSIAEFYKSRATWQPECKECLKARSRKQGSKIRAEERANGVMRRNYVRKTPEVGS